MSDYNEIQKMHYDGVAAKSGLSASSTMADATIRETETSCIIKAINTWCANRKKSPSELKILDAGCGNGNTLKELRSHFPNSKIIGIEHNEELFKLSSSREDVEVFKGDLRDPKSLPADTFDVILTQRVLINIMNKTDQAISLSNISDILSDGGLYIAIEAFNSGFNLINHAREELGLQPISMPYHNLYLEDDFFKKNASLNQIHVGIDEYFLSTHYYLSYVLYPALSKAGGAEFKRDNITVPFLDKIFPNQGSFGANRFITFEKV